MDLANAALYRNDTRPGSSLNKGQKGLPVAFAGIDMTQNETLLDPRWN
jgi:hypothetical protein